MFDALKAPNLPRFARITAVEVASHRRGDNSTVEYEVVTTVADTSGQLHEVSSFHRHSHFCRVHSHVKSELPAQFADDAKPLLDEMRSIANEAFGKNASAAHMPYKTDDETGEIVFKTKSKYQPRFVDASGKNVDATSMPPVFGGSTARIAGNITPYDRNGNRGISLQLNAVQVIELAKSQTGANFGAVEGGFVANDNSDHQGEANYNF